MTAPCIKAVLFDLGGIFITQRPEPTHFVKLLGLDPTDAFDVECVDKAMWSHRDQHDLGMSDKEFWASVALDIGIDVPRASVLRELVRADVARMHDVEPRASELASDLKDAGIAVGILANAPTSVAAEVRSAPWAHDLLTHFTFSSDLHVRKPHSSIYRAAAGDLQLLPEEILFIDDRSKHVRGAQYVGMHAMVWEGASHMRDQLRSLNIL